MPVPTVTDMRQRTARELVRDGAPCLVPAEVVARLSRVLLAAHGGRQTGADDGKR